MLDLGLGLDIGGLMGTFSKILLFAVIGIVLYFLTDFVIKESQYNKKVIFREILSDNRKIYFMEKARKIITRQGVFWRLKKLKRNVSVPPTDALESTRKGGLIANAAIDATGQITWLKDSVNYAKYKDSSSSYEPLTSETMADYAREYDYNKSLRKEGFMDKFGAQIIGGFILIILVVVLSISWGKFTEPLLTAQEQRAADLKITKDILDELREIKTDTYDLEKSIERQENQLTSVENKLNDEVPPN